MNEVWVQSPFEKWEVSTSGRIRNKKNGRILCGQTNDKGYVTVCLYGVGTKRLHRIIASTFIPNPHNLPEINHIDGDKLNNSVSNLEWCTHKDNMHHAAISGLRNGVNVRITEKEIEHIKNNPQKTIRELGTEIGFSHTTVRRIRLMLNNGTDKVNNRGNG